MSLLIDLFGDDVLNYTLEKIKQKIKQTPADRKERRIYLLKEWGVITNTKLSQIDFDEVTEDL